MCLRKKKFCWIFIKFNLKVLSTILSQLVAWTVNLNVWKTCDVLMNDTYVMVIMTAGMVLTKTHLLVEDVVCLYSYIKILKLVSVFFTEYFFIIEILCIKILFPSKSNLFFWIWKFSKKFWEYIFIIFDKLDFNNVCVNI